MKNYFRPVTPNYLLLFPNYLLIIYYSKEEFPTVDGNCRNLVFKRGICFQMVQSDILFQLIKDEVLLRYFNRLERFS